MVEQQTYERTNGGLAVDNVGLLDLFGWAFSALARNKPFSWITYSVLGTRETFSIIRARSVTSFALILRLHRSPHYTILHFLSFWYLFSTILASSGSHFVFAVIVSGAFHFCVPSAHFARSRKPRLCFSTCSSWAPPCSLHFRACVKHRTVFISCCTTIALCLGCGNTTAGLSAFSLR